MSSHVRLKMIETLGVTAVCCTPSYALRLAEVAAQETGTGEVTHPLSENSVRVLIVAGEAGGSIATTRELIERSWNARVIDHYGLTEAGPIAFECWESPGALHLNEGEYICEVLEPSSDHVVLDGQPGELVVTNLGRRASPVIRYRTGDIVVRRSDPCRCGRTWARLEGGILARADHMISIRGVNVYPTAIESVVRHFPEIVEYRATASHNQALWTLAVEIEPAPEVVDSLALETKLSHRLREALGLSVPVRSVEPGSLPRFEMKARRFVVER
jgi:phenylacetate-CoA ligase